MQQAKHSALATWRRRCISIPATCSAFLLVTLLSPVLLSCTAGLDLLLPLRPWARTRCLAAIWWILFCELLGLLGALLVWMAHLVRRDEAAYRRWNLALQRHWTDSLFGGARRIYRLRLEVEGIEQAARGPYLLLMRHASVLDTLLSAALIANPKRLGLRYVLKEELRWDPCLDVVGGRLRNAFVSRGRGLRSQDLQAVGNLAANLGEDAGVLIYPEGTRFSEAKRQRAIDRLSEEQQGEQQGALYQSAAGLRHLLPPRPGGVLALRAAAPELDLLLFAHTGLEVSVTLGDFWRGELLDTTIVARVERVPAASLPRDPDRQVQWLYERWAEMDLWIGEVKAAASPLRHAQ